jgi:hypothetical protein
MEPEHYKFGGGAAENLLHPIVLVGMIIVVIILLTLNRKCAIAAFLFGVFLIPAGQQIVVAGIHIFAYRIIVLAGLAVMVRLKQRPILAGGWNSVDTAFMLSVVCHVVAFSLLYSEKAALVNQAGFFWDYLGGYVFVRYAIRNREDGVRVIRYFAFLSVIFAVCMIGEQFTGTNIFGELGGVPLISEVREGRIRSEAVFQHAILAGTFGAVVIPLFVMLWKTARSRAMAIMGITAATVMAVASACSTPILAYVAGFVAIIFWPLRRSMRLLRWGIGIGLVCLHFVMRAPVWYVIAHVAVIGASSANHRADLVDTFITHISDWWLLGTNANNAWGHDMFDTSNQYVNQGVTGGLASLAFFILVIARSFGRIGNMRKAVQGQGGRSEWALWLLGSALFANIVAFFGISYFDQTRVGWFVLLAMICAETKKQDSEQETPKHSSRARDVQWPSQNVEYQIPVPASPQEFSA